MESSRLLAAGADQVGGGADILGVDGGHVAAARGNHLAHAGGVGEKLELVERLRIAALRGHGLFEFREAGAIHQMLFGDAAGFLERGGLLAQVDHARGQFERELGKIVRSGVLQGLRRLHDFQRIADGIAQGLAHVGDEGLDLLIHAAANADHHLGQAARIHLLLHEGAGADFDVEDQRVHAFGQLLRHDRRGNQRDGLDGGGDVAQGIELQVGRHQLIGLPDEAQADFGELLLKLFGGEVGAEAGDGFELVERAAGVAQGAPGHHGHDDAGGGGQRGHDQAGLIADSAGGVLVHLHAGNRGKIDALARAQHAFGEAADFAVGHAQRSRRP